MAILESSRKFEGSDISGSRYGRITKEDIRSVSFKDEKNKSGNFFYLLPAYKLDASGRGVWFKQIRVRKNFGIDVRESFVAQSSDPVSYFESQAKLHFPDYIATKEVTQGTKKVKVYPTSGNVSNSILYNAAYVQNLDEGAHVLVVPSFYVGQTIDTWTRSKDAKGNPRPMLNDHKAAIAIRIELRSKETSGNPWLIEIDSNQRECLPEELADTDYLYDLDEAVYYPETEYLIEKLRSITPGPIFDTCMKGYFGKGAVAGFGATAEEDNVVMNSSPAPAFEAAPVKKSFPKVNRTISAEPTTVAPSVEVQKVAVANETNPSTTPLTSADIQSFLRKRVVKV